MDEQVAEWYRWASASCAVRYAEGDCRWENHASSNQRPWPSTVDHLRNRPASSVTSFTLTPATAVTAAAAAAGRSVLQTASSFHEALYIRPNGTVWRKKSLVTWVNKWSKVIWQAASPQHMHGIPYTLQWAAPPSKLPIATGASIPSNTWFLGPTASRSVQPYLQGSRSWETDRPTDHATSVTVGRIYVRSTATRPKSRRRYTFARNFAKCWLIFEVCSPSDSAGKLALKPLIKIPPHL